MNVTIIGLPNYCDASYNAAGTTIMSWGSYLGTLTPSNLQNRHTYRVWRTVDASTGSSFVQFGFGVPRLFGGLALIKHNITSLGLIRVRFSNDATFSTSLYDSGWVPADYVPQATKDAEPQLIVSFGHILPSPVTALYLRLEINDPFNPKSYIQAGRLIAGPAFTPSINMQYGWQAGMETTSTATRSSKGNVTWMDVGTNYGVVQFQLSDLTETEIFSNIFEQMDRRNGIVGDVYIIPQPDHYVQLQYQAMHCRMRVLNQNSNPNYAGWDRQLEFEQLTG